MGLTVYKPTQRQKYTNVYKLPSMSSMNSHIISGFYI